MLPINTFDIVLFSAQVLVIYIVVLMSLYNLTQSNDNKNSGLVCSVALSVICFRRPFSANMFLTLPSNSSMDIFPEVHLPKEINLSESWELGLSEILYVNS